MNLLTCGGFSGEFWSEIVLCYRLIIFVLQFRLIQRGVNLLRTATLVAAGKVVVAAAANGSTFVGKRLGFLILYLFA